MSDKDFFSKLSKEEKKIIVNKGTEEPFSGEYNNHFEAGVFICKACLNPLYQSNTKFDSNCGWPSFDQEIKGAIIKHPDHREGRERMEICCGNCNGHLGHVFYGESITIKDTRHCVNSLSIQFRPYRHLDQATFGAGCFWGVEKLFREVKGIYSVEAGYMGGNTINPNYEQVCTKKTNHAEVVHIYFDPKVINYQYLLKKFWNNHNPTTLNRQGSDIGSQYRSVIFFYDKNQFEMACKSRNQFQKKIQNKIITEIKEASVFYRAEEYHQNYINKNKLGGCRF